MPSGLDRFSGAARRLGNLLTPFRRDRRGNIALTAALLAVVIVGATGGAIDLGSMLSTRTRLQDAADAASLAAVNAANAYYASQTTIGQTQQAQGKAIAQTTAQNYLAANTANLNLSTPPAVTVTTSKTSGGVTTTVSMVATMSPTFLSLMGINSLTLNVSSTSTDPVPNYYQIMFLVDVSNSMAIGGTTQAIQALQSNSKIACAFACHDPNHYDNPSAPNNCYFPATTTTTTTGQGRNKKTTTTTTPAVNDCDKRALAAAANPAILLKIDYVKMAIQDFLTQLQPYATAYPGHFSVGITTFGTTTTTLLAPTTSMSTAQTAAQGVDVEAANPSSANYGYTYTTNALNSLKTLPNVGDGSTSSSMITYVIFLSDGVEDQPGSSQWGRGTDLSYTSACTSLNKTMRIFSIWAPYYPITSGSEADQYAALVAPLSSKLGPTMQTCAWNPNYYFTANDGPSIQQAVNTTFNVIISNTGLRVSQ